MPTLHAERSILYYLYIVLLDIYVTHAGKSVNVGVRGTVRVFPYLENDPTGQKRSHQETLDQGKQAISDGTSVR